jgi:hypothetical protein
MNTEQIIRTVESIGGLLFADGGKIRLKAPAAGVSDELKDAIREHKQELLEALCQHSPGCPHSLNDLLGEYQRNSRLRVEYKNREVWLVRSAEMAASIKSGTVYTFSEWSRIQDLTDEDIRQIHALKAIGGPGGSIEIRP